MTVKAVAQPASYLTRIALLHEIRCDLDKLEASLSPVVREHNGFSRAVQSATGVRKSESGPS
jgi:hypothetical protein